MKTLKQQLREHIISIQDAADEIDEIMCQSIKEEHCDCHSRVAGPAEDIDMETDQLLTLIEQLD